MLTVRAACTPWAQAFLFCFVLRFWQTTTRLTLQSYHQPGQSRLKKESILCSFAEAELSLGGLQCVCVLAFRSSPVSQAGRRQADAAVTNRRCVQRWRKEAWACVLLSTLVWWKLELLALNIFAASLSFSPIIDLIKHDYQHYAQSLLWLFESKCFCFIWRWHMKFDVY